MLVAGYYCSTPTYSNNSIVSPAAICEKFWHKTDSVPVPISKPTLGLCEVWSVSRTSKEIKYDFFLCNI